MLNNKKEKLETSTSVVAKGEWNPQTPPPQSLVQEINAKITKQTAGTENSWTLTKKKTTTSQIIKSQNEKESFVNEQTTENCEKISKEIFVLICVIFLSFLPHRVFCLEKSTRRKKYDAATVKSGALIFCDAHIQATHAA